jgi:hypothetical protein
MAKLKAPLFSLGASGQLGKALVFFGWKGLNVVREHVVPANPKTTAQNTQRGYLTEAVAQIHTAQAHAFALTSLDVSAYALWGSTFATPRTWFNQAVKNIIDQLVKAGKYTVCKMGVSTPASGTLNITIKLAHKAHDTGGSFYYGTSKTALVNSMAADVTDEIRHKLITGLTNGVKYYWQYRSSAPDASIGIRSGIYYGTPAA